MDAKQRLAALSDEERQRLVRRLTAGKGQSAGRHIRPRPAGTDAVPLSYAQQRIWFLNQLAPLNLAFNVGRPTPLGAVNLDALQRALNELVRRHESLRTTFHVADGVPVQRVAPFVPFSLPVSDLRDLPPDERKAVYRHDVEEEQRRPWALDSGRPFRVKLWRLADDQHILLVLLHHIVSDGWSWGVMVNELTALYTAFSGGRASPLPELQIQYADFAVWQREWVETADCKRQLAYWRERHSNLPVTRFVPDYRETGSPADVGIHKWMVLSRDSTRDLKALCQREGVTLFMTVLAAFAVLLSRYTGQRAVVVGSPIANRNRAEIENLIGCFMNPLPLNVDLGGDPAFRELLRRVRDLSLSVYSNQDVPFDLLVKSLQPKRDPSNTPLFQVMLLLQNYPWRPFDLSASGSELDITEELMHELDGLTGQSELVYPVALEAFEAGPFLAGSFQYSPQYATTFSRVAEHFRMLLESIVANPDARIGSIPMFSDDERRQIVAGWSGEERKATAAPLVHSAFEQVAARQPHAPAAVSRDHSLTYEQLNADANRLARHLRALGARPGAFAGILLHRSTDLVTALLAVLKTGAAYVPLDPAYPANRLTFVMEDTAMPLLITTRQVLQEIAELHPPRGVRVVCLEEEREEIARQDAANPGWDVLPSDVAYVIYTSGSTGTPKGVPVPHGAIANYTAVAAETFGIAPGDRVLQFASISFDTAAEEIYPCLTRGATLVLRTNAMIASAGVFLRECDRQGITVLDLPTAYWHELTLQVCERDLALPESIRLVILGGEQARADRVHDWQTRFAHRARLLNTYGPTEATVVATMHEVPPAEASVSKEVPIGRPIRGARTYVLDKHGEPVSAGVPGELYIGGAGLALGYLNRSDLTAEKFVPDHVGGTPGGRLYRTGDLVRYLGDGTIEFLGRVDHQVKLRGYRIELPEIEAALARYRGVTDNVVVVRADEGEPQLVAYVVAPGIAATDLRRWLKASLPEYMVPSAFVALEALPLTPNGKVDRDALPRPAGERQVEEAFVAPTTEMERRLARHWQDILRVGSVGIDDNFFDLGGHSLLVVQLHSRLRAELGEQLAVLDLFRFPTIRSMALHLTPALAAEAAQPAFDAIHDRASRQRSAFSRRRLVPVPSAEGA